MVFNSAKNRYDNNEEIETNRNKNNESTNEDFKSINASNSTEAGDSSRRNSQKRERNEVSKISKMNQGFLGGINKPDEKKIFLNNDCDNLLTLQIKYALNKVSNNYSANENLYLKSPVFNYYCGNYSVINNEKSHENYLNEYLSKYSFSSYILNRKKII